MFKYFQKRKKRKLYQQWVEMASLPSDAIPRKEVDADRIPIPQADKQRIRLNILSILLGVAFVILCTGLILLLIYSC
jgi:hypothetical protein